MFNRDAIPKILKEKNWSRYKLCKEAHLAQSTLSDILSGKAKNPNIKTLQKIADTLDVSINEFFDDTDSNTKMSNKTTHNYNEKSKDIDIRRIERARNKMPLKDREKMMKILEASFEDYFDDED